MIGFNHLGRHGRLGNQMFQYAGLRGIAAHKGYDFCIPPSKFEDEWHDHQLFECFKLVGLTNIAVCPGPYVQEAHFHFDKNLFDNTPDGHNVYGYLQSEKWFKHIESEIRQDFEFKNDIHDPCVEMISSVDRPIALHVRRGDYLTNCDNHPPCTKEYYDACLSHFDSDRNCIVFSDDPVWCHEQFTDDRFLISEGGDNVADLCMMSLCDDFIIANSSFSWWGSWLSKNPNKRILAPERWFGTGYTKNHNTSDLYCDNWEVVSV
jgi:hypothetical protein|tara:strand:+ start:8666 stop:9454 length:789 start_codon:yes stop_codon:yes gene_type:complete